MNPQQDFCFGAVLLFWLSAFDFVFAHCKGERFLPFFLSSRWPGRVRQARQPKGGGSALRRLSPDREFVRWWRSLRWPRSPTTCVGRPVCRRMMALLPRAHRGQPRRGRLRGAASSPPGRGVCCVAVDRILSSQHHNMRRCQCQLVQDPRTRRTETST